MKKPSHPAASAVTARSTSVSTSAKVPKFGILKANFTGMLLLMTVEPGFGGQKFLDLVLPKIRRARQILDSRESSVWLQVDGGVTEGTIERAAEAGADVFVAGSAVYGAQDPAKAVDSLRALAVGASDRG